MSIPQITQLPPAPQRSDAPADFVAKADAHVASLSQFVTQTNQVVSDINVLAPQVADDAALASASAASAAGIANYKGLWSSLSGALNVPASVKHNGSFYFLVNNLANVALSEPGSTGDWQLIVNVGNIRKSLLDSPLCRLFVPNKIVDTLAGALTSTRASTATYVDRYGVVRTAANDELREEKEGWLIEGQSTNLLTYSEQFDNAAWIKTNVAVSADVTAAPDGTLSADKLVENSTPDGTTHFMFKSFVPVVGQEYTVSCYVKAAERTFCVVKFGNTTAFPDNVDTYFNLADGTFTDNAPSIVTPKMKKLGNGWYRCSVTATAQSNAPTGCILTVALNGDRTYSGDGSSGLYVWGAQVEQLPFASSYIPTTTAPATRARDDVSAQGLNNYALTSGENTIAFRMNRIGLNGAFESFYSVKDSRGSLVFNSTLAGGVAYAGRRNSENTASSFLNLGLQVISPNTVTYIDTFKDGVHTIYSKATNQGFNSVSTESLANGTLEPTGDNSLEIIFGDTGSYVHIQDFRIYDFALNADEVTFLSGGK